MKKTHIKQSKKIYKYQILSIILLLTALLLMILSICPFVHQKFVGIFQGLSTGLLSGMVLLLITGIKTQEQKHIQKIFNAIHMCNLSFPIIISTFSNFEQYIFHDRKSSDGFEELSDKISTAYTKCQDEYTKLVTIDLTIIPEDICQDIKQYLNIFKKSLNNIEDLIIKSKNNKDEDIIANVVPAFYTIGNNTLTMYMKIIRIEEDVNYDKNRIDTFLF